MLEGPAALDAAERRSVALSDAEVDADAGIEELRAAGRTAAAHHLERHSEELTKRLDAARVCEGGCGARHAVLDYGVVPLRGDVPVLGGAGHAVAAEAAAGKAARASAAEAYQGI